MKMVSISVFLFLLLAFVCIPMVFRIPVFNAWIFIIFLPLVIQMEKNVPLFQILIAKSAMEKMINVFSANQNFILIHRNVYQLQKNNVYNL